MTTARRVSVVTGGGSGIGRATARRLAADGDLVVIADLNQTGGQKVVDEINAAGGIAVFQAVDVADASSIADLADTLDRESGPVGALVNCAGILQNVSELATFDLAEHDRIWAVNYRGTYLCCRAFVPALASTNGSIVNISSTSAVATQPLLAYAPAKAAIERLTTILALELGAKSVRVNAVRPGYVLTEQMQSRIDAGLRSPEAMNSQSALGRMIRPEEVAEGIRFLCSPAASAITGSVLTIDAGYLGAVSYRQHPGLLARRAAL